MKIEAQSIPHILQRYDTVGDYWTDVLKTEHFRVSKMPKEDYEWLVLIHEIVERYLCKMEGVENDAIDTFDIRFEKAREAGKHSEKEEPGDDPRAPYGRQHCIATAVERLLCGYRGIPWAEYEKAVQKLSK